MYKPMIAALFAMTLITPLFAQSQGQIQDDRRDVVQQRHEVRQDIRHGNGVAAYYDRKDQKAAQLDLRHDQINRQQHIEARHIVATRRHYVRHHRWHRG